MNAIAQAILAEALPLIGNGGNAIPEDIQWMPPGRQKVTPYVNGEPKEVEFDVDAALANAFGEELQEMRSEAASGSGDVPFIDFNHDDDASAGEVLALYWGGDDAKSGGIRARVKWSAAGKSALEGKNYRRFSPQWRLDQKTGEPLGLTVNMGGLVNRAAFRTIQALAKGQSGAATKEKSERQNTMTREEFQQLLADGLKPITEKVTALEAKAKAAETGATAQAAGDDKIIKLITDSVAQAQKPLLDKITAFEDRDKKAVEARAKEAVQAHVKRGAIAPEDKETVAFYEKAALTDLDGAEKAMAKLPGKAMPRIVTGAGGTASATSGEPEDQFIAKAKEFAKANNVTGGQAEVFSAFARTPEGSELYKQFRSKIVPAKK